MTLDSRRGGLGDHVLREGAGPGRRVVEVVDDALDRTEEVIHADVDHTEVQIALVGDGPRVAALVVALVLGEAPGEGLHALSRRAAGERRHGARVEPAAEIRGHGHVASQVQLHGLREQRLDPLLEVLRRVVEVDVVVDLPVPLRLDPPAAYAQQVAGQQFAHALEERLAGQAELECEVVLESIEVGADSGQERQQRLGLGREVEDVADLRVVERLDPEPVARAQQLLLDLIPERIRKHPPQAIERAGAPAIMCAQHNLGVAVGPEGASQLEPQLGIVVDLAVVGDPAACVVPHRLVAGRGRVDDAQAPMAEADMAALVYPDARVVRTAMSDEIAHHLQARRQVGDWLTP